MTNFSGKTYIVTGASSGIGKSTVLELNKCNAKVVAIARNKERLDELKSICQFRENIFIEQKDLTEDIEFLPQYIKELKEKYGRFSGMAYCAGITDICPLRMISYEEIKKMFDINYFAPIFMLKGLADKRNNIGEGTSIVVVSSLASKLCDKGHVAYSGSKSALSSSIKCISKELLNSKIRLNIVSPSNINTPMTQNLEYGESQNNLYPFGFGEAEDVSNLMIYLLSNKAKFISGQNFVIDSGGVI